MDLAKVVDDGGGYFFQWLDGGLNDISLLQGGWVRVERG
jgi:hypothetical protein